MNKDHKFLSIVMAVVSDKPNKTLLVVTPKETIDWDSWEMLTECAASYTKNYCTQKQWVEVNTIHGGTSIIYLVCDMHLNKTIGKKYDNVVFIEE